MKLLSIGKVAVEIITGLFFVRMLLLKSWRKFSEPHRLIGKTFLITGANSGIGKSLTEYLYNKGAHVIMVCRDEKGGKEVAKQITQESSGLGSITLKKMDLSSFHSVRSSALDIIKSTPKINALINNAAIMQAPFKITEDLFENHMQVNHLSHALLTNLLLPKLAESGSQEDPSRVVYVSSSLYKRGSLREEDLKPNMIDEKMFVKDKAYSNSKLASLLYVQELSSRLTREKLPVTVNLASPGMCYTNLGRYMTIPWYKKILFFPFFLLFVKTASQGAQTILHAAASSKVIHSNGAYFADMVEHKITVPSNTLTPKRVFDLTTHAIRNV